MCPLCYYSVAMTQSILYKQAPRVSFAWLLSLALLGMIAACQPQTAQQQDAARIALGATLFRDPALSADGQVSCSSCHDPNRAFSSPVALPQGVQGRKGTRNAPSLLDVADMQTLFWDGRENQLETVVVQPLTNQVEMALPALAVASHRLRDPTYRSMLKAAFPSGKPSTEETIATALAAYLRSLPKHHSRYDRYLASQGQQGLSQSEKAGLALFTDKADCASCHRIDDANASFSDHRFHHAGISFERVAGRITPMLARLDALQQQGHVIGQAILTDPDVAALGRFAVTRHPAELGAFRTPSLRNVARTAPYMHDGSVQTLPTALDRELYYRGLARGRPIELTVDERHQLLAFLRALSDEP